MNQHSQRYTPSAIHVRDSRVAIADTRVCDVRLMTAARDSREGCLAVAVCICEQVHDPEHEINYVRKYCTVCAAIVECSNAHEHFFPTK
jgi:hypothetical protein